ncbi:unnamed protein product, partial [Timema podura]|nr:unnamed protein product [Timema podura]
MAEFVGPVLPPHLKKKLLKFSDTEDEAGSTIGETVNVKQMMNTSIGPLIPPGFNSRPHQDINKDTSGDADITFGPILPQHLSKNSLSSTLKEYTDLETTENTQSSAQTDVRKHPEISVACLKLPAQPIAGSRLLPNSKGDIGDHPETSGIGPELPTHFQSSSKDSDSSGASDDDMYGPALPPRLGEIGGKAILGPTLPPGFKPSTTVTDSEDSDAEVVGPLPPTETGLADDSYIQRELERRAQKMKRKLAGEDDNDGALKRESWMLELPPDRATEFGLGPRQFRKKEKLDPGDKSVWTDTPADRLNKKHSQKEHKNAESEMHQLTMRVRDEEMEQLSRKHPSSKNRQESLLEAHQRELNKKK